MESSSLMLREVPIEERPRERMLQYGGRGVKSCRVACHFIRTGTVVGISHYIWQAGF